MKYILDVPGHMSRRLIPQSHWHYELPIYIVYHHLKILTENGSFVQFSRSEHKYPSNCGWPSFFAARPGDVKQRTGGRDDNSEAGQETVKRREDNSLGMTRVEVSCRLVSNNHIRSYTFIHLESGT